jgi:hypothetical protein
MKTKTTTAKRTTKPATTPAAPKSPAPNPGLAVGDLVEFYDPSLYRRSVEKVSGFIPEHNYVTLESGRHFPAYEVVPVVEA